MFSCLIFRNLITISVNELAHYKFDQVPVGTTIADYSGSNNVIQGSALFPNVVLIFLLVIDPSDESAPSYQAVSHCVLNSVLLIRYIGARNKRTLFFGN